MSKKRLNEVYKFPLPLNIRPFPPVIPHNPLSILWVIWEFVNPRQCDPVVVFGQLDNELGVVKVHSCDDMNIVWKMGFFGKGTLSRSEPTWFARMETKLGLLEESIVTSEDITRKRRSQRKKFKEERARAEQIEIERIKRLESESKSNGSKSQTTFNSDIQQEITVTAQVVHDKNDVVIDDVEEINASLVENGRLRQLESLQLMPTEVIFLSYGLGVLRVENKESIGEAGQDGYMSNVELFKLFISNDSWLIYEYVAYHHYRSLGWCVRSGVKFGTDLILYRRGPPFSHAAFAVVILPVGSDIESQPWWWNTSVGRVIGGVKKTLVFCYVDGPNLASIDISSISEPTGITTLLKSFTVREVVYRRWIPNRNKD